ncbi:MAG: valine--tRNA ligase, partial [archaeon]
MALDPKPDFKSIESKWQKFWLDKKVFAFDKKSKKPVFSIDTPPPTISGDLHIGHATSYTHFDVMGHYMRQKGFNVLQPIGFDDNGHPTERYVETLHKIDSKRMGKLEFNTLVRKEIPKLEEIYKKDLISLGQGYDWDVTYKTVSPESVKLVQTSFLDLYKKGFAYRSEAPTIWCTKCQTALAQADLEDKERETKLNYIDFKVDNQVLQIATTRPEFLPACVGVFVHPDDKRYKKFVGKSAVVPISGQKVKIMADGLVDQKFGTGAVMICTFGDKTDIEWWRKHKLPLRIILEKDGRLNQLAGKYAGMKLEEARKNIIEDMQAQGLLKRQESLKQSVAVCWRCPTPTEYVVTKQWFVKVLDNKKKFLELGRKIKWHPEHYIKLYENWVENLNMDWLISRQRHFGPQIPAWYCKKCQSVVVADEKDLPVDPEKDKPKKKCACGSSDFEPEHDVFDTWMTSSLTPQLVLGWNNKKLGSKVFPMTVRASGRDIIRTWEFYTIVKSFYHFKSLPWTNTLISGMVFDPHGEAMHKSKGNTVAPQGVIQKFGADAFRYWAASSIIGEDSCYQEKELTHAQKLLIKLWNVARFVELWKITPKKVKQTNAVDMWIKARLCEVIKKYAENFDNYDPVTARRELEQFFWEFCDYYLEMIKHRLYGTDEIFKEQAKQTLYAVFGAVLKMFAPIMPHLTEEIYQELFKSHEKSESIHLSKFPDAEVENKSAIELGNL